MLKKKDKEIGIVLGGHLKDKVVFNNNDNICINTLDNIIDGNSIITYEDINTLNKRRIFGIVMGLMLEIGEIFDLDTKEEHIIEVVWKNKKKSLISIKGERNYKLFISKMYSTFE